MDNIFFKVRQNLEKAAKPMYMPRSCVNLIFCLNSRESTADLFKSELHLRKNRQPVFLPVELLYGRKSVVVGSLRESQMLEHYHQTGDAALPDDDG